MAKPLTNMERELLEDVYFMGAKWLVRQPNGDLVAFKVRPKRSDSTTKRSRWIPEYMHSIPLKNKQILVSKEKSDFPRTHKTAPQPTSVLDLIAKHHLEHLWADEQTPAVKEKQYIRI